MAGLPWIKVHTDLPRDPRSLHLADLLADARAWTYVLQMRLYLAEHAAAGTVSGLGAVATVERSAGWMGERGRLVDAMRDAGFVRAGPARDGGGTEVVDLDWLAEQGAHVEKFARDAKKPRGNSRNVVSPSRDIGGTSAGPSPTPRGKSRELRVESREEASASQGTATPSQPEDFALQPTGKQPRKPRKDSPQEVLYRKLESAREERCAEVGEPFIPDRWSNARQNKDLGGLVRDSSEAQSVFARAWGLYLANDAERAREPAWALGWFMAGGVRARYETQAAREAHEGEAA